MKAKLMVFAVDIADCDDLGRRFRFAVVDTDKAKDYPANFVCLLPLGCSASAKSNSVFYKIFKDKSLGQAKLLLTEALKAEGKPEVNAEITRRLKLLEPKTGIQMKCSVCGKVFETKRVRRFSKNMCQACIIKRYWSRQ